MDPLSVLREFAVEGQLDQVVVEGDRIRFGERYSFQKAALTSYKSKQGGFYSLHSLVFLLKQPEGYQWGLYMKQCREAGVLRVDFTDRKDVEDYLKGRKDRSDAIQLTAPELVLPGLQEADGLDGNEPRAKRARTGAEASVSGAGENLEDAAALTKLLGKERQLRDRNSQMIIHGKSFKRVLDLLGIAQREQARWKGGPAAAAPFSRPAEKRKVIPVMPSGRFDRPAGQDLQSANFQIDAYGSKGQPQPPPPPGGAPPPPPPSSSHKSRSQQRPSAHAQARPKSGAAVTPPKKERQRSGVPIILVPAATSAKINMLNVREFLEQGSFKPPEVAKKEGAKKEAQITIHRRLGRAQPVRYVVTEKAPDRKSHDWDRVVAVFVSGAAWQFKEWPHTGASSGDMVSAFHSILGVHVSLKNEQMSETVKAWNVQRYQLHPVDRHRDQSVVLEFWNALDKFLAGKNSQLTY